MRKLLPRLPLPHRLLVAVAQLPVEPGVPLAARVAAAAVEDNAVLEAQAAVAPVLAPVGLARRSAII